MEGVPSNVATNKLTMGNETDTKKIGEVEFENFFIRRTLAATVL